MKGLFFTFLSVIFLCCNTLSHNARTEFVIKTKLCFINSNYGVHPVRGIVLGMYRDYDYENLIYSKGWLSGNLRSRLLNDSIASNHLNYSFYSIDTLKLSIKFCANSNSIGRFKFKVSAKNIIVITGIPKEEITHNYSDCIFLSEPKE